jgi:hypothetical protein
MRAPRSDRATRLCNGWRRLAKACETIGVAAFACCFIARLGLFFYYIWHRPLGARPSLGWTEALGWGRYGSIHEAANLSSLWWGIGAAFGVIVAGQFVRIYKLGEHVFENKTQRF